MSLLITQLATEIMLTRFCMTSLIGSGLLSVLSAQNDLAMSLFEFQRLLRTGLDDELVKIMSDETNRGANSLHQSGRESNPGKGSHVRRRSTVRDNVGDFYSAANNNPSSFDFVWNELTQHAQNVVRTISRGERGSLTVTDNPNEAHSFPFLICIRGLREHFSESGSVDDVLAVFDKQNCDMSTISSSLTETCLIVTTTALKVQQVLELYEGDFNLITLPMLDIAKIHFGTIDEVSSRGWSVPFRAPHDDEMNKKSYLKNETEELYNWERIIEVKFVPGLGGMKEEAQLLAVVNVMMGDIQDMGEVGWLRSLGKYAADKYLIHESLTAVPSMSDIFSVTSSLRGINANNGNARIKFWQDSFRNGIEAEHACSEMFTTLFVKPRSGYYGYDLVLNPSDGPPPQEYDSSSSNPACVISLIAGLSIHPYVQSVKANFPIYHGWHVARELDSVKQ